MNFNMTQPSQRCYLVL